MLHHLVPERIQGFLPLEHYAAIGDGRSVALIGADGSIDWWCAPEMNSPPLFNRMHDRDGGRFSITPAEPFEIERQYRENSNVLETTFITEKGRARVTESLNSGVSGRLPWCELARRIEGLSGSVEFQIRLSPICARGEVSRADHPNAKIRYIGDLTTTFCHDDWVEITLESDDKTEAKYVSRSGERTCIALLVADQAPLAIPRLSDIDARIDLSDEEWRRWAAQLTYDGPFAKDLVRCALSLKFLLFSETGAIAAAATAGLPERVGGDKNYDYRFAWVRDAAYTIKALLRAGALSEPIAAFGWLVRTIEADGPEPKVVYTLRGNEVPDEEVIQVPGYLGSSPVRRGNRAKQQIQLSCYGDFLETAWLFAKMGHVLDPAASKLLARLADQVVERWQLERLRYLGIGGSAALHNLKNRLLAGAGPGRNVGGRGAHRERTSRDIWSKERDNIRDWIDENCWSHEKKAYSFYAGTDRLDASLLLATRFGFDRNDRLRLTRHAIEQELAVGPLVYRYSGAAQEEGTFVACSCWLVEAYAFLGEVDRAEEKLGELLKPLGNNFGILNEQIDPATGAGLGNMPQGLSHLALLHAIFSIQENHI
jgi:GH15 family glucan-1,4-alpha-glucosidase